MWRSIENCPWGQFVRERKVVERSAFHAEFLKGASPFTDANFFERVVNVYEQKQHMAKRSPEVNVSERGDGSDR